MVQATWEVEEQVAVPQKQGVMVVVVVERVEKCYPVHLDQVEVIEEWNRNVVCDYFAWMKSYMDTVSLCCLNDAIKQTFIMNQQKHTICIVNDLLTICIIKWVHIFKIYIWLLHYHWHLKVSFFFYWNFSFRHKQ